MSNQNPQEQSPPEHQTNVPAILILLLVTAVISVGIVSWSQSVDFDTPQRTNTARQASDIPDEITYKETRPVDTTSDIPAGILSSGVEVVQNRHVDLGSRSQRIVVFDASQSSREIASRYRNWLQENNYEITNDNLAESNGSLVAENGDDQIIFVFSQDGTSRSRVQLSYVTPANN